MPRLFDNANVELKTTINSLKVKKNIQSIDHALGAGVKIISIQLRCANVN